MGVWLFRNRRISLIFAIYEVSSFYNVTSIFETNGLKIDPYSYITENSVYPSFVNDLGSYTPREEYLEYCNNIDTGSSVSIIRGFMSWVNFKYIYLPFENCMTEEARNEIADMFCYTAAYFDHARYINSQGYDVKFAINLATSYLSIISENILGILTDCLEIFGDSPPNLLLVALQNGVRNLYIGEQIYINFDSQVFLIDEYQMYASIYGSKGFIQNLVNNEFFYLGSTGAKLIYTSIDWNEVRLTYDPSNTIFAYSYKTSLPYYGKKAESSTISSYGDTIKMLDNLVSFSQYSRKELIDLDVNLGDELECLGDLIDTGIEVSEAYVGLKSYGLKFNNIKNLFDAVSSIIDTGESCFDLDILGEIKDALEEILDEIEFDKITDQIYDLVVDGEEMLENLTDGAVYFVSGDLDKAGEEFGEIIFTILGLGDSSSLIMVGGLAMLILTL